MPLFTLRDQVFCLPRLDVMFVAMIQGSLAMCSCMQTLWSVVDRFCHPYSISLLTVMSVILQELYNCCQRKWWKRWSLSNMFYLPLHQIPLTRGGNVIHPMQRTFSRWWRICRRQCRFFQIGASITCTSIQCIYYEVIYTHTFNITSQTNITQTLHSFLVENVILPIYCRHYVTYKIRTLDRSCTSTTTLHTQTTVD